MNPETKAPEAAIDIAATDTNAPAVKAPIAGGKPAVDLLKYGSTGVALSSLEDAFRFAKAVVSSGLAPRGYDKPEAVLIAIQMGAEVGLPPMAALSSIAVINGRPSLYGDAMPGVVNASGLMESYVQEQIGSADKDDWGWKVTVRRKGRTEPVMATFTVAQAKRANLWAKAGPWTQYPDRMLLMRARTFALRDAFNDVLRGMVSAEEAFDTPKREVNITPGLDALEAK